MTIADVCGRNDLWLCHELIQCGIAPTHSQRSVHGRSLVEAGTIRSLGPLDDVTSVE